MQKYLITGFSGFVGYYFVHYLNSVVNESTEVLGLDIAEPPAFNDWNFSNLKIRFEAINLLDKDALYAAVKEFHPTHILHLAAFSSVGKSWQNPSECFLNNTGIFLNIVETVRLENIKCRILCVGSSEEYGEVQQKDIPIKETLRINPSSPYAVTKFAQEAMSECYVKGFDLDIILTRSFNHIGPRQKDTFVIASFVKKITQATLEGKKDFELPCGNIDVIRDFSDVRDVVRAYYLLFQKGKAGEVYNVCSGNGISLHDIIKQIAGIAKINVMPRTDPGLVRPTDLPIIVGSNKKIFDDTGWENEFSLKKSLKDIFDYWRSQLTE